MTDCNFNLDADRPDRYFPDYHPGQLAILVVRTGPNKQVNRQVYRKRWFTRELGINENWIYQGETSLDNTDENGVMIRYAYLPNDPDLFGYYYDEYFIRGCPNKDHLEFNISPRVPTVNELELAKLGKEVERPIEKVRSLV